MDMPQTAGTGKKGKMSEEEMKYQTEDDMRTMQRMGEMKKDPERMKRVKAKMMEGMETMKGMLKFDME